MSLSNNLQSYAVDGKAPKTVLSPRSYRELAQDLTLAAKPGSSVTPRGNGTKIGLGNIPRRVDVVLSTLELNEIVEYEPADLVATVQTGMTLKAFQEKLAEKGQFLPLDPPHDTATIGGIIAANDSGPRRLFYGSCRDMVIGMKVATVDGKVIKCGGKVVKNVAGYDMNKLFIGSLGTLGIILESTFRIRPLPETNGTIFAAFPNLDSAADAILQIRGSELLPSAIELVNPALAETIAGTLAMPNPRPNGDFVVLVDTEETKAVVTRQLTQIRSICQNASSKYAEILSGETRETIWTTIKNLPESMDHGLILKLNVLPSMVHDTFALIGEIASEKRWEILILAHAGTGTVYLYLPILSEIEQMEGMILRLRSAFTGSLVVESAPVILKEKIDVWGDTRSDFRIMKSIKERFDPLSVLNPGRFVGRL